MGQTVNGPFPDETEIWAGGMSLPNVCVFIVVTSPDCKVCY